MQYIIAGFTDIKSELRIKTRTNKDISELRLWFAFHDDILYVHDYSTHKICTVLAIFKPAANSWEIYMRPKSYGEQLVIFLSNETPLDRIAEKFNHYYESYGFFSLRLS